MLSAPLLRALYRALRSTAYVFMYVRTPFQEVEIEEGKEGEEKRRRKKKKERRRERCLFVCPTFTRVKLLCYELLIRCFLCRSFQRVVTSNPAYTRINNHPLLWTGLSSLQLCRRRDHHGDQAKWRPAFLCGCRGRCRARMRSKESGEEKCGKCEGAKPTWSR